MWFYFYLFAEIERTGTLDAILSGAYCRSQLSREMAKLRSELTMPMFSEITHRFQTARAEVRALLLRGLLPWLENMELVATSVPPATPLSYIIVSEAGRFCTGWDKMYTNMLLCMLLKQNDVPLLRHDDLQPLSLFIVPVRHEFII